LITYPRILATARLASQQHRLKAEAVVSSLACFWGAPRAVKFLARLAGSKSTVLVTLAKKLLAPGRAPLDGLAHG